MDLRLRLGKFLKNGFSLVKRNWKSLAVVGGLGAIALLLTPLIALFTVMAAILIYDFWNDTPPDDDNFTGDSGPLPA